MMYWVCRKIGFFFFFLNGAQDGDGGGEPAPGPAFIVLGLGLGYLGPGPGFRALDYGEEADPLPPTGPHFDFPKHKSPRPPRKLPGLVRASGKLRSGAQPGCPRVSQVDDSGGLERRRNAQGVC